MRPGPALAAVVLAGGLSAAAPALAQTAPTPAPPTGCSAAPVATEAGPMYSCSFAATATSPERAYWLYVPPGATAALPLVVYLHGCTQNSIDAAYGSRWNQVAAKQGFLVVYPQQTVAQDSSAPLADGNGAACWNWFLTEDQQRGAGEPAAIAGLTEAVVHRERADSKRVYVLGVSAGADMSVILAANYPDVYAAYGAFAGCAYSTCTDAAGRQAYQAMGSRHRVVPGFVEQGTADTLNPFPLGQGLVDSWLQVDQQAEQAIGRSQVALTPSNTDEYGFDQTPEPGRGDPCVHNSNFPCPGGVVGFQGTYPFTVEHFVDGGGCDVLDFWVIHGLEHAYPDGSYDATTGNGTFTDPLGPDVTAAAWSYFSGHPMRASGC